jgi:ParB-like nuclease family protein
MSADLKFHPLAGIFPLMEGAEFDELVADIKAHGLREPIVLYEGLILDGRNRYRACIKAGVEPSFAPSAWRLPNDDPAGYVISANIRRRHLTAEQKRDLIAKLLKARPEKSNRQIGKQIGASHHTVKEVRTEMEGTGQIAQLQKTVGADGKARTQPAKKAKPEAKARLPKHDSRIIAPRLADRVGRFAHDLILSDRLLARELANIIMLPGVRERLSADLTNGLALLGNDADPDSSERTL